MVAHGAQERVCEPQVSSLAVTWPWGTPLLPVTPVSSKGLLTAQLSASLSPVASQSPGVLIITMPSAINEDKETIGRLLPNYGKYESN